MCGIVVVASLRPIHDRAWLSAANNTLRHRGPDGDGEWWSSEGNVGLAHRRLAIIDLSERASQPMWDAKRTMAIVFNGEIYNFRELRRELMANGVHFQSESDTEVVLAAYSAWGLEFVSRLNGMFAFAIYDSVRKRLVLGRDRAGEKPLFFAVRGGELRAASELKAMLASPAMSRDVDLEALDCYLGLGFVPGGKCIISGVQKLPAAHVLVFSLTDASTRFWRYWAVPSYTPGNDDERDTEGLLSQFEALLEDSVRRQLVADVPVGVLLSGGVDSSLVTAMAVRASRNVKTFTIRFPGHKSYDETAHARMVSTYFGTDHVEMPAEETTVDLLPKLARQFDEPVLDSSMVPTFLVSKLVRRHCTVALGGDGGDELFAGYPHYSRLLVMCDTVSKLPRVARVALSLAAERLMPLGAKGRNWLISLDNDWKTGVPHVRSYFDRTSRGRLLSFLPLSAEAVQRKRMPPVSDAIERATRLDFENYLAEDILVKVDRTSMLTSLEVRAPLLDYRIVEFAFSCIPSHLKATYRRRKILPKMLAEKILPKDFDLQRKQGFSIPLGTWLQSGPWLEFFRETLLSNDSVLNQNVVRRMMATADNRRRNSERLFGLVMLELWRREYGLRFSETNAVSSAAARERRIANA